MTRRERTLATVAAAAVLFAVGCARLLIGVLLDEITVLRVSREQMRARGPANRDAREIGRTTSDDNGVW